METLSVGLKVPVTTTVEKIDTSNVENFLGTDKIEDKSIVDDFQSLPETIGNSTDEWKANTAIMKEFGNAMPELVKSLRQMNDAVIKNTQTLPSLVPAAKKTSNDLRKERIDALNRQNVLGFFNTGSNMIQGAANGNVGGSLISGVSGMSTTVNNFSQMANVSEMTNLAKGLMIGGGVLMAGAAVLKGGKALADAYKDAMPTIFGTGKAFGTTDDNMSMALYKQVNKYNEGTNLDNAAFNSLVVNLRKQGVGNNLTSPYSQVAEASRIAETTAQWAYKTGGDANQFANLAGIMSRYGGSINVADDFNRLVSAGYASGLNDSQIPEFLSGIQKVMEDGIAKGFSRSATEVADTMLLFSKLSGNNAFWQGEQGAKLINQASAGLAGATSMSKTTDLIAFGAINRAFSTREAMEGALGNNKDLYMNGSSYINEMMILEQGLNKGNFGALMGGIYNSTADDNDRVEKIRSMFGLNYTGARRVQELYDKYKGKEYDVNFEKELKNITDSPKNQNDETAYRKSVNKIAEALQTMGQPVFNLELKAMDGIATDVSKIANFLVKPDTKDNVFSAENPIEEDKEKRGAITTEYEINKGEALARAEKLPEWKQRLIRAQSSSFDPQSDGSGWGRLVDHYENFDITKDKYDSPMIEKVSSSEAPGWMMIIPGAKGQNTRREWAQKKGFKITQPYTDDATVSDFLLEPMQNFISTLSLSNGGKVSQDALLNAIEKSPEIKNELKKDVKNGYLEENEIKKLSDIMNKIYAELLAGINVNQTM